MRQTILTVLSILLLNTFTFAQQEYNAYVFIAEECPISIYMAKPLREAARQFDGQVNFYAVFPSRKSSKSTATTFLQQYELPTFEAIVDRDQSLTQNLGAEVTPEVVITDATTKEIVYRGRVSNAYASPGKMRHGSRTNDLINMLKKIMAGEVIQQPWPSAVGCYITKKRS